LFWVNRSEANRTFFNQATNEKLLEEELRHFNRKDVGSSLSNSLVTGSGALVSIKKYMIAACLLVAFGAAIYLWTRVPGGKELEKLTTTDVDKNDVQPGSEKAVLTLGDGTKIAIDNLTSGTVANQGNTVVVKDATGLAYNTDRSKSQTEIIYNTLTTPKGGEYRSLVLSDGTKVWLNSISSIRFPTSFIEKDRRVEITGEAYFEVAKDPSRPFKVSVNGMVVEVLGTHFNINAYPDEGSIKTTLVEGTVRVVADERSMSLKAGEQASLSSGGELTTIRDANIEEVIAWKNGYFEFHDASIETIMRQVSRWYDVDVQYEGKVSQLFIGKKIPRSVNVSALFEILEATGWVHFKIDGKKITVMP
jgi:transmembrane sensor